MDHLSLPHRHLALTPPLKEGRTDLHVHSSGFFLLQSSYKYCVDQVSFHKNSTEHHRRTEPNEHIEHKTGDSIERENKKKYSTELAKKSSSKDEREIINS